MAAASRAGELAFLAFVVCFTVCREIGNLLPNNQRQRRTCYALCHILYPVSAAHTSIFRMDSNSTSYHCMYASLSRLAAAPPPSEPSASPSGDTTPCKVTPGVKSLRPSYTGLYPQTLSLLALPFPCGPAPPPLLGYLAHKKQPLPRTLQ